VRDRLEVTDPVPLPADVERERTVDAFVEFAAAAATEAPLLVVVDDAHWADASTVGLLRTLVRRAARLPVLVLVAYRDVELDRRHPLAGVLADWRRQPYIARLGLRGLERGGVGELAAVLADTDDLPAELVAAISAETDGNPFFVRELLLHLIDEGGAARWTSTAIAELEIPEGVRETIGRRLSRLSDDTNRLLAVASAFEVGFRLDDVAAVGGLADEAALDAIDEALGAQMLRPGDGFDRYEFVHALIRHTLWAEMNPSRQVRLHRAIADQIEKRTGHNPTNDEAIALAYHFHHSAALPGAERGVGYALTAADQAAARFAATEELQAVEIALELLLPDDERIGPLHERAANAATLAADWPTAIEHAQITIAHAERTKDPLSAVRLAIRLGTLADQLEPNAGWAYAHLTAPYQLELDPASPEAVQLLAWEVSEAEYLDPDNPGIAVDSPQRRHLNALADALPPPDRPPFYFPSSASALLDRLRTQGDLIWYEYVTVGRYRQALTALRALVDELLSLGGVGLAYAGLGMLGRLHLVLGELDRARDVQAEGEHYLPRVEPNTNNAAQIGAVTFFWQLLTGADPSSSLPYLDQFVAAAGRPDVKGLSGPMRLGRAPLLALLGRHDEAVTVLSDNLRVISQAAVGEFNLPLATHWACQAAWLTQQASLAPELERNLHTKIIEPGFCYLETDTRWDAALLAALTGRYDEARDWFEQAYKRLVAQEAILLIPHVCCDEALMEIRRGPAGDRANGRQRLDEARRWVDLIGLPNLLPRIDDLQDQLVE
jgi:tetratricopeptide (TPR) repeat protein